MLTYQKKFNRKYTLVCVCTYTEVISKICYYSYISLKQVLIHNYIHDRLDFFFMYKKLIIHFFGYTITYKKQISKTTFLGGLSLND